ncbi:MAG: HEAT repeat domain-containing protein [Anaerolineae bacterium]|nr:HEAT repeat domain-containing protein [Anaerolineae bacterium]
MLKLSAMNSLVALFDPTLRFQRAYAEYLCARFRYLPFPGARVVLETEWIEPRGLMATLSQTPRLVITGAPGTGKTTTLVYLAVTAARRLLKNPRAPVPLFFSARPDVSLPYIYDVPRGLTLSDTLVARTPRLFFPRVFAEGRALVLIDDADTLDTETLRIALKEYQNATIIASAEKPLADFVEYRLPGFRDSEIEAFANKLGVTNAATFVASLKTNNVPRVLTSNPLTLRLLAYLWQRELALPTRRTDLFDAYVQATLSEADTLKMLGNIALDLQYGRPVSNGALAKSRGFLRAVKQRAVEFAHPLWQAYFAARALQASGLASLRPHLNDPAWREVILFYAGLGDATDLVLNLQSQGEEWLAARAAAHAFTLRADLRETIRQTWLKRACEGDAQAINVLREMHDERVVEECARELQSPDARTRQRAAEVLGQLQMDRAVDYLLPRLRDADAMVRETVVQALGRAYTDRVIEPLLVALRGDSHTFQADARMRCAAARALGEIGTVKAVPALVVALQQGTAEMRAAAANALKRIHSPLMIESLQSLLQFPDDELRQYAQDILATMNGDR